MKQLPHGVIEADLQEYLFRFQLARAIAASGGKGFEALDEKKAIDLFDILFTARQLNAHTEAYEKEYWHNQKNLENISERVVEWGLNKGRELFSGIIPWKGKTQTSGYNAEKEIMTGDGSVKVRTFEWDLETTILHVYDRVKVISEYGVKTVLNVNKQNPTGFLDVGAFRVIIEHPDATKYRIDVTFNAMRNDRKKSVLEDLSAKTLEDIFKDPKKMIKFRENGTILEYSDLNERQRADYNKRYSSLNTEAAREFAQKLVSGSKIINFVPVSPPYVGFDGGIEARLQTQLFFDLNQEESFQIDYILPRSVNAKDTLGKTIISHASKEVLHERENITVYKNYSGGISYLVDKGDLVLNFSFSRDSDFDEARIKEVLGFASILEKKWETARKEHRPIVYRAGKGRKEEQYSKDVSDEKIMESMKLKPGEFSPLLYGLMQTSFEDIRQKYGQAIEVNFDSGNIVRACVKDRFDPRTDKGAWERGHRDIKVYPNFDPKGIQICAELQIRTPDSDYVSEFGVASHDRHKREKYGKLNMIDQVFSRAFFGEERDSRESLSKAAGLYYSGLILNLVEKMKEIDTIQVQRADAEPGEGYRKLEKSLDGILKYSEAARRIMDQIKQYGGMDIIRESVKALFDSYAESKGMGIIAYHDSLWAISSLLAQKTNHLIPEGFFENRSELSLEIHKRHLDLLLDAYKKLTHSGRSKEVAASMFVGEVIRRYNANYGHPLPDRDQKFYRNEVTRHSKAMGWRETKIRRHSLGYGPRGIMKTINSMSLDQVESILSSTKLAKFDDATIAKVAYVSKKYLNQAA